MKRLLVFASGTKNDGGSGAENLVDYSKAGNLDAEIVAVVSNHENGGVKEKADRLGIQFIYFGAENTEKRYKEIVEQTMPDFISLSGWLLLAKGSDPEITINIHPAILPETEGLYGHSAHEKVIELRLKKTAVTMHFVTEAYDKGLIFFQKSIDVLENDTPETLGSRVNEEEHYWQPLVTNLVVQGLISWDGKNPKSLKVPLWYYHHKPINI